MHEGIPALVVGAGFLLALVWENLASFRLPDALSLPGLAATLAAASVSSLVAADPQSLIGSTAGAAAIFTLWFAVWLAWPNSVGFGTVKASALLGAAVGGLGIPAWIACSAGMIMTLVVYGVASLRLGSKQPTGPALAVGLIAGAVTAALG